MQTNRRKPVCHTCLGYMEGHKRVGGSPVCPPPDKRVPASVSPGRSLISPPPSPSRQTTLGSPVPLTDRSLSHDPSVPREPSFEVCNKLKFEHLPGGGYRRRNPNWDSAADLKAYSRHQQAFPQTPVRGYRAPSPAASLVPTVLDDHEHDADIDQISDVSSDDDAFNSNSSDASAETLDGRDMYPDTRLGRQGSFVARIADYAKFNKSMVTIFRAKKSDVDRIEQVTSRRGVYTATMSRSTSGASSSNPRPIPTGDSSMLVVLGKSPDFVDEVAARTQAAMLAEGSSRSSSEKYMPGTLTRNPSLEGPRLVTFFQMFIIAAFTSVTVVFGISLLG
ncbi:hypothetical protein D9611_002648 [Ephemerocybe angulata]|uniref:Uncharacterized protein n=1 Tax=Ephemerocybe angulata TaxID=980116 RepID=A0A8H5FE37_9AGAR|nr:hypothetical protein D9611_002648 [Tulosesus angulatus]